MIYLLLLASPIYLYSQEFAPVGALWHYTQLPIDPQMTTFKSIESISDTIVHNKSCKKMIEIERYYSDTVMMKYHYMYSENDSVFFFAENEFHLLYDFGAIAGDTIILNYFLTASGLPLKMIIDSTGMIDINGEMRSIQYITCGDGLVVEFGKHVIQNIGSTFYMFPTYDGTKDGPLRCYQDDYLGLFLSPYHPNYGWNHQDCNQIITGIHEQNYKQLIKIYPNPVNHSAVYVDEIEIPFIYSLFKTCGEMIKKRIHCTSNEIPVSELEPGSYLLLIEKLNSVEPILTFKIIVLN